MASIRVDLSPVELVEQFRTLAEFALRTVRAPRRDLRSALNRKGLEMGLHLADVAGCLDELEVAPEVLDLLDPVRAASPDYNVEGRPVDPTRGVHEGPILMSNPRYLADLARLDGVWDLSTIIGPETIMIVTGCSVIAELLDRPVAELLRDEIDFRGTGDPPRRAVVIGDTWWWADATLHAHHAVAIGNRHANSLTAHIVDQAETIERAGLWMARVDANPARVALWGEYAYQTRRERRSVCIRL